MIGLVDVVVPIPVQDRASWAGVLVGFSVVAERFPAEERSALIPIRDWHVCTNAGVFQGTNNLDCAVGRVAHRTAWPELPAETGSPHHIEERHVLHHVSSCDQ